MTNTYKRTTLLACILAGTALVTAGCGNRTPGDTTSQKVDRAADKVASATERAGDKVASATERAATKTGAAVEDATITTKVKSAVLAEPGLKTLQIGVDTKEGVVTLSGTVDTPVLKEKAMQIAQQVDGVRSVVDNLAIKTAG